MAVKGTQGVQGRESQVEEKYTLAGSSAVSWSGSGDMRDQGLGGEQDNGWWGG